jgi:hypothetical protein
MLGVIARSMLVLGPILRRAAAAEDAADPALAAQHVEVVWVARSGAEVAGAAELQRPLVLAYAELAPSPLTVAGLFLRARPYGQPPSLRVASICLSPGERGSVRLLFFHQLRLR